LVACALVLVLVLGCEYSPHFVSGVTRCANAEPLCPSGFICDPAAGVCVTSDAATGSDAPADHAGDTGTAGADGGGDAGANDAAASDAGDGGDAGAGDAGANDAGASDAVTD
jgi:hypothetical protein